MPRAILLVDHGSRVDAANLLVAEVADLLRARHPEAIVEIAHMEIASPTIAEGIARCVAAGAEEIAVHPYFLGPGRHTRESIPALVESAQADHPGIAIRITEPLGLDDRLVDVIERRIAESLEKR
jgi:sirohydrochlorin ferrochelatase